VSVSSSVQRAVDCVGGNESQSTAKNAMPIVFEGIEVPVPLASRNADWDPWYGGGLVRIRAYPGRRRHALLVWRSWGWNTTASRPVKGLVAARAPEGRPAHREQRRRR